MASVIPKIIGCVKNDDIADTSEVFLSTLHMIMCRETKPCKMLLQSTFSLVIKLFNVAICSYVAFVKMLFYVYCIACLLQKTKRDW